MKRLVGGVAVVAVAVLGACSTDPSGVTTVPTTTMPTTTVVGWSLRDPMLDIPGITDEVPSEGLLPDGTYLGDLVEDPDGTDTVSFLLMQGWFGDSCYERFATEIDAGEARCMNDIEIVPGPGRLASLSDSASVFVSPTDYSESKYEVDPGVLADIARGAVPVEAPADWMWVPFPFLLRVSGGTVVAAVQIWLP